MFASLIGSISDNIHLSTDDSCYYNSTGDCTGVWNQTSNLTGASTTILLIVPLILVILFIAKLAGKI